LCRRFARLFDVTTNKLSTVAEMYDRDGEDGREEWTWRRRLWVWEEELVEECRTLLTNVVLQQNVSDRWQWELDKDEGYKVRDAYHALTHTAAPLRMRQQILPGISRSLTKYPLLRGGFCRIGYQLKSIFNGAVLLRSQTLGACRGAGKRRPHPICSFIVTFLVPSGSIFDLGLA